MQRSKGSANERFWNRVSILGRGASLSRTDREIVARCRAALSSADRLLDVGCGTGHLTRALAPSVLSAVGIDTAAGMIERAQGAGEHHNLRFRVATVETELASDPDYSAVSCFNVLPYVADPADFLTKLGMLAGRDGSVLLVVACLGERNSLVSKLVRWAGNRGAMPECRPFKIADIQTLAIEARLSIIESMIIDESLPVVWLQYKVRERTVRKLNIPSQRIPHGV
ncbi:class I SAM-dependent methyltransferase [Pacificispira sp.]|uniref:class I SAM-dependent methyltransferase n=1 Tax=Pacificispira sp. TaxID=2888761 RepID=UPI003B51A0B7